MTSIGLTWGVSKLTKSACPAASVASKSERTMCVSRARISFSSLSSIPRGNGFQSVTRRRFPFHAGRSSGDSGPVSATKTRCRHAPDVRCWEEGRRTEAHGQGGADGPPGYCTSNGSRAETVTVRRASDGSERLRAGAHPTGHARARRRQRLPSPSITLGFVRMALLRGRFCFRRPECSLGLYICTYKIYVSTLSSERSESVLGGISRVRKGFSRTRGRGRRGE